MNVISLRDDRAERDFQLIDVRICNDNPNVFDRSRINAHESDRVVMISTQNLYLIVTRCSILKARDKFRNDAIHLTQRYLSFARSPRFSFDSISKFSTNLFYISTNDSPRPLFFPLFEIQNTRIIRSLKNNPRLEHHVKDIYIYIQIICKISRIFIGTEKSLAARILIKLILRRI